MIEHREGYTNQYEQIKDEIRKFLADYPDIPAGLHSKVENILRDEVSDVEEIKNDLLNKYDNEPWREELFICIARLESNEAFVDLQRKQKKQR